MKHRFVQRTILLLLVGASVFGPLAACAPRAEDPPNSEIVEFSVQPNPVCVNVGVPFFRVYMKMAGPGCIDLYFNDEYAFNFGGVPDGGRCSPPNSPDEWDKEYGASLSQVFGTNIPSQVQIRAELRRGSLGESALETLDSEATVLTTQICQPPTLVP